LIIVFVVLSGVLLAFLFKHATKDRAYVRTGYGGEVIAQNAGIFILPVLHHAVPVNLKVISLEIELADESAVLTQDYMKANLSVVFYVRVNPDKQSISQVARTLGNLTLFPDRLKDFLAGRLIHVIRKVSAEMSMADIHLHPDAFTGEIQQAIAGLSESSLHVDLVTLKYFDQTAKEYYSEENAFDAEGLSGLTKIIESEKLERHEIQQQSLLLTKQKDLEMEKLVIDMENKKNQLRLDQERDIKIFEAANKLAISQDAIQKNAEEMQTKILAEQEMEIFRHKSENAIAEKLREKLKQQIQTDLIKAEAAKAEVRVELTRKLEKADSLTKIKLLKEKIRNEHEVAKIVELATARKKAAGEDAQALRIKAEGEADRLRIIENSKLEAEKLIESSLKNRYLNEAEGLNILIDAFTSLPKSGLPTNVYPELVGLFSDLCLGNNQLIRQCGHIEFNAEETTKAGGMSGKNKTKLQAILDDARSSLTREAVETINDSGLKINDELVLDK
jgi:uncharacterized membrane protein YqiK